MISIFSKWVLWNFRGYSSYLRHRNSTGKGGLQSFVMLSNAKFCNIFIMKNTIKLSVKITEEMGC